MSFRFYFEDGHGNVVDEVGNELMEVDEEDPFQLEELNSYTSYLKEWAKNKDVEESRDQDMEDIEDLPSSEVNSSKDTPKQVEAKERTKNHNRAKDEIKAKAVHMVDIHPKNSARAVALELKLEPRTVQRWYKAWKEGKEDALFKPLGRPRIIEPEGKLAEDTKSFVTEYNKEHPSATMDQLMKELTENFENLKLSKATLHRYMAGLWELSFKKAKLEPIERNSPAKIQARVDWVEEWHNTEMDYMTNCVFIDEAAFHVNLRRTQAWSSIGSNANVKVLTARANTLTILGAISTRGVIKISLRKPIPPSKKKKACRW